MNLTTRWLGLELPHPFMPGASPLVDDMDTVRRLEDAGAAAIVMHSLFEEQITREAEGETSFIRSHAESFPEALDYFPPSDLFALGPEEYLQHLARIKEAVSVPVIASLNGSTPGGWLEYATRMQDAGADALELNLYILSTDPAEEGSAVEERSLQMLRDVRGAVRIPVALKLSPFYTSLAHFARLAEEAGAAGLVLFNRFYQADIDVEDLEVDRSLHLSEPSELLLRLRWLAILSGRTDCDLAVSGGVHGALDAVKAVMAGASAVQMVSALLRRGPSHLARVRREMEAWMEEHEYDSLEQMRGSMDLTRCPDPAAFERANYMHILQTWRPTEP